MSNKKILIIEDDPVIVLSLEFLMEQNGYQVTVARDGDEAMRAFQEPPPDLILMDVMLPKLSGYELCQTLRAKREFDETKIILLTAKGREVDVKKGLALGADTYVTKPFSTRDLVQTVKSLLGEPGD